VTELGARPRRRSASTPRLQPASPNKTRPATRYSKGAFLCRPNTGRSPSRSAWIPVTQTLRVLRPDSAGGRREIVAQPKVFGFGRQIHDADAVAQGDRQLYILGSLPLFSTFRRCRRPCRCAHLNRIAGDVEASVGQVVLDGPVPEVCHVRVSLIARVYAVAKIG